MFMKRLTLFMLTFLVGMLIFAVTALAYENLPEQSGDIGEWIQGLIALIGSWASLGWRGLVAGVIVLLIAVTKFTFIKSYWDKLGVWKFVIPLALGAVAETILNFPVPFQWGSFIQVIIAGVGGSGALSIAVHHVLDQFIRKRE